MDVCWTIERLRAGVSMDKLSSHSFKVYIKHVAILFIFQFIDAW